LDNVKRSAEFSNHALISNHDWDLLDALDSPKPHRCTYSNKIMLRQLPMRAAKQKGVATSTSTRSNRSAKK